MQILLKKTSSFINVEGVRTRIWEGKTENGIGVTAFICRLAVKREEDIDEFEKELEETPAPKSTSNWGMEMIL